MKHSPQPSPRGGGPKARSDKQQAPPDAKWVALLEEVLDYAAGEWRLVCKAIRRGGRTQTTKANGKSSNPLVAQRRQLEQTIHQFGSDWNKAVSALPEKQSDAKVLSLKERLKALEGGK